MTAEEATTNPTPRHVVWHTKDIYAAGFLYLMGAPLIRTEACEGGRSAQWLFDNADGRCDVLYLDYRSDSGSDLVGLKAWKATYRTLQQHARTAKERYYVATHNE